MTYFKNSFLNLLRDELGLTVTHQRLTVFHFFYLAIPASGLGFGIVWGMQSHITLKVFIGGAIGFLIGGISAWQLPKLLWKMLRLFASKGWFLQPAHRPSVPVMTANEFITRSKALRLEGKRQFLIWSLLFIAVAFCFSQLCFYMDRTKPKVWIQVSSACGIFGILFSYFVLRSKIAKQNVKKHGLQCPACGREITAVAGLAGMPYNGLCNQCGTKVIEIQ